MVTMAMTEQTPTSVQVAAARVRVKADKRLKRETPAQIKKIAEQQPAPAQPAKSA